MDFSSFSTFCGGCDSTRKQGSERAARGSEDVDRLPPQNWEDVAQPGVKNLPFEFTAQQQLRDDSPEDALHLAAATGNLSAQVHKFLAELLLGPFCIPVQPVAHTLLLSENGSTNGKRWRRRKERVL
eukprot:2575431-Rhodomonas_salina.3